MLKGQTPFLRAGLLTPGRRAEITDLPPPPKQNPLLRNVPAVGGSRLKPSSKQFSLWVLREGAGNFPCACHPSHSKSAQDVQLFPTSSSLPPSPEAQQPPGGGSGGVAGKVLPAPHPKKTKRLPRSVPGEGAGAAAGAVRGPAAPPPGREGATLPVRIPGVGGGTHPAGPPAGPRRCFSSPGRCRVVGGGGVGGSVAASRGPSGTGGGEAAGKAPRRGGGGEGRRKKKKKKKKREEGGREKGREGGQAGAGSRHAPGHRHPGPAQRSAPAAPPLPGPKSRPRGSAARPAEPRSRVCVSVLPPSLPGPSPPPPKARPGIAHRPEEPRCASPPPPQPTSIPPSPGRAGRAAASAAVINLEK
ncbi:uncharacterized protein LOC142044286 [Buteo buteo]|uniref:uncharacterized protein LOC142044286 n=1 Tax=Buteo buteo TaxID=30397 RepID=UPI003EBAC8F3